MTNGEFAVLADDIAVAFGEITERVHDPDTLAIVQAIGWHAEAVLAAARYLHPERPDVSRET